MAQKTIEQIATDNPITTVSGSDLFLASASGITSAGAMSVFRDWVIAAIPNANGSGPGLMTAAHYTKVNGLSTLASSGTWADISGKPTFSDVATSGDYADLTNTPGLATDLVDGLMSAADKDKLDGLENYVLPDATEATTGGVLQVEFLETVTAPGSAGEAGAVLTSLIAALRTAGILTP